MKGTYFGNKQKTKGKEKIREKRKRGGGRRRGRGKEEDDGGCTPRRLIIILVLLTACTIPQAPNVGMTPLLSIRRDRLQHITRMDREAVELNSVIGTRIIKKDGYKNGHSHSQTHEKRVAGKRGNGGSPTQ